MPEIRINSFEDLHRKAAAQAKRGTIYRGQTKAEWQLIPKLGRLTRELGEDCCAAEHWFFQEFRNRAVPYVDTSLLTLWDWLAAAQHHGLPTRLLDWTKNLLVAAYFAVEETYSGDSVVFSCDAASEIDTSAEPDPLKVKGYIRYYTPRHVTPRLAAQAGCFTVHPKADDPCPDRLLKRYIIAAKVRDQLRVDLCRYGINRATLFPGLDGLASYLTWDFSYARRTRS